MVAADRIAGQTVGNAVILLAIAVQSEMTLSEGRLRRSSASPAAVEYRCVRARRVMGQTRASIAGFRCGYHTQVCAAACKSRVPLPSPSRAR